MLLIKSKYSYKPSIHISDPDADEPYAICGKLKHPAREEFVGTIDQVTCKHCLTFSGMGTKIAKTTVRS